MLTLLASNIELICYCFEFKTRFWKLVCQQQRKNTNSSTLQFLINNLLSTLILFLQLLYDKALRQKLWKSFRLIKETVKIAGLTRLNT